MERKDSRDDMMFRQAFNENREMLERLAYFSVRDKEAARDIVSSTFDKKCSIVFAESDMIRPFVDSLRV